MATWRFYQGLRTEWRWYELDHSGDVKAESDQGFAELRACMDNAAAAGFTGTSYQVQVRQSGAFTDQEEAAHEEAQDLARAEAYAGDAPDEQTVS